MRAADSEVEPPSRELARIAEIDVDALLMLACEIAGLSVQNRDDLVRRNGDRVRETRSEEHTSELQSLMRISYAVFCLKKKKNTSLIQVTRRTAVEIKCE